MIRIHPVSLKEVARAAGVSVSTVSKVFHESGNISAETIRRIQCAADALGYQPNRAAQLLSSKSKAVGYLLPDSLPEVYSMFDEGFETAKKELSGFGYTFRRVLYSTAHDETDFPEKIRQLSEEVNGIVFIPYSRYRTYDNVIRELRIPAVALQSSDAFHRCPSVCVDAETVGKIAAEFLFFLNAKKTHIPTAVITGDRNLTIHRSNIEGYLHACEAFGLRTVGIFECFDDMALTYRQTEQLLLEEPDIRGIFVTSYTVCSAAQCLSDHGKREQVSLIGVDLTEKNLACLKNGTVDMLLYQNQKEQAVTAFRLLTAAMRGETIADALIIPEPVLRSNAENYK